MTDKPLTNDELEAIKARLNKIADIDWTWKPRQVEAVTGYATEYWLNSTIEVSDYFIYDEEAEFIVHAKDDMRKLIAYVEDLKTEHAKALYDERVRYSWLNDDYRKMKQELDGMRKIVAYTKGTS